MTLPNSERPTSLWSLGFRPFYLLASLFSVFSILLWVAQYSGLLPAAYLRGSVWHAHEMLFGYTTAVVAGFLLTAVRNWTNRPTPTGIPLMAMVALWLGGRVLVLTPFEMAAAVVNAAFLSQLRSLSVFPYSERAMSAIIFVGLLVLMAALVLLVHATLNQRFGLPPRWGLQLALDVVLFIMVVMSGRVIPMFTNNAIPGTRATRYPSVEKIALGTVLLLFLADSLQLQPIVVAAIALAGALGTVFASRYGSRGGRSAHRWYGSSMRPTDGSSCTSCCAACRSLGGCLNRWPPMR